MFLICVLTVTFKMRLSYIICKVFSFVSLEMAHSYGDSLMKPSCFMCLVFGVWFLSLEKTYRNLSENQKLLPSCSHEEEASYSLGDV